MTNVKFCASGDKENGFEVILNYKNRITFVTFNDYDPWTAPVIDIEIEDAKLLIKILTGLINEAEANEQTD
jgi:hypothetical protein